MKKNVLLGLGLIAFIAIMSLNITLINDSDNQVVSLSSVMKIALAEDGESDIEPKRGYEDKCCACPDLHHIKVCCPQGYADSCTKTCD